MILLYKPFNRSSAGVAAGGWAFPLAKNRCVKSTRLRTARFLLVGTVLFGSCGPAYAGSSGGSGVAPPASTPFGYYVYSEAEITNNSPKNAKHLPITIIMGNRNLGTFTIIPKDTEDLISEGDVIVNSLNMHFSSSEVKFPPNVSNYTSTCD